jgi:hypothetical protein
MGWRIRRSIRLMPGVRLNLSKGGVSTSIGRRGATVNFGKNGTRSTIGLPGSGISYSTLHSAEPTTPLPAPQPSSGTSKAWVLALVIIGIMVFAVRHL